MSKNRKCANPQSNRLHTIAVRASYILPIWGVGLSPSGKTETETSLFFFSFGVDLLNWQSFTEIDGIARSTTAGVLVDTLLSHYLAVLKRSIRT